MEKNQLKTAILYSGGKDSTLALQYALKYTHVKCLIIMISKNRESYMFHTPNIYWAEKQAEAIGIPSIVQYTEGEKEYCSKSANPTIHYAARWAAKEAAFKALGTGWSVGVKWKDVEVKRLESGKPELHLYGQALAIATSMGVSRFHVSLTHDQLISCAVVIFET